MSSPTIYFAISQGIVDKFWRAKCTKLVGSHGLGVYLSGGFLCLVDRLGIAGVISGSEGKLFVEMRLLVSLDSRESLLVS